VSTNHRGRWTAVSHVTATQPDIANAPVADVPQDVIEFIRYCYQRRGIGWPELYDEMCAVAARGEFRGMDYERLATMGVGFSLCDMNRLAALAQRVVFDERRRRVAIVVEGADVPAVLPAGLPIQAAITAAPAVVSSSDAPTPTLCRWLDSRAARVPLAR